MSTIASCVFFYLPLSSHSKVNRCRLLDGRSSALEPLYIYKILTRIQARFEGPHNKGSREPWRSFPVKLGNLDANKLFWTAKFSRKGRFSVAGLR